MKADNKWASERRRKENGRRRWGVEEWGGKTSEQERGWGVHSAQWLASKDGFCEMLVSSIF